MRVILVTGSTDGIGRETARRLAAFKGDKVIVHGRAKERCENAIKWIKSTEPDADVDYVVCDFADLTALPTMAKEVAKRFPNLNSIVCNAGVLLPERQVTKSGYEMAFAVNHLAHFALVNLLLDLLKKNQPARIVVVSSICYDWHPIDWNDLMSENSYEKYVQYSRTKLANHLFTFALARRLKDTAVTCNVYEPGVVETKLLKAGGYSGAPAWTGSITAVYLIQSDDVAGVSGAYFDKDKRQIIPSAISRDEVSQERLWDISLKLCRDVGVEL